MPLSRYECLFVKRFSHHNLCCAGKMRTGSQNNFRDRESACLHGASGNLVAPYCAIPRDYLSHIPPIARYGVFGVSTWPLGCDTPPSFLSVSPFESMRSGGVIPPPPHQKGYLSDTCAIPYENKANGCDTPLCDTISKGYCAIWGVSRTGPLRAGCCGKRKSFRSGYASTICASPFSSVLPLPWRS